MCRRCSVVVAHSLGKGGVVGPIPTSGTIKNQVPFGACFFMCIVEGNGDTGECLFFYVLFSPLNPI